MRLARQLLRLNGDEMSKAASEAFRAGVMIVVARAGTDEVMAFERSDKPGNWQLPQGGIDLGETPVEAAWREMAEETGLRSTEVRLVAEGEWLACEWPAEVRAEKQWYGQVQRWFYFEVLDAAVEPSPDGIEFVAWQWISRDRLAAEVVPFRQSAYVRGLGLAP